MSAEERQLSPAIGLDIGTSRIVMARRQGDEYRFQSQLNAFINVPFSKVTERALQKEEIPFARSDGHLVIHGNESERFAELLGLETRRPMMAGMLNPTEKESTEAISSLVDSMLGEADENRGPLYYSVPAPPLGVEQDLTYHQATIQELLTEKGFQASGINEGLAVVYGELEDSNYTGIGVSCGGGLCNVCLAYLSLPVLSFSVPKAGDFIDSRAAAATGDPSTRIRIEKESHFHFNGKPATVVHQALAVYYDEVIRAVVDGLCQAFADTGALPKFNRPVPLVLSGGTAMPKGFAARFEKALQASDVPVQVSEVRLAKDPLNATAKGALVAALAEC